MSTNKTSEAVEELLRSHYSRKRRGIITCHSTNYEEIVFILEKYKKMEEALETAKGWIKPVLEGITGGIGKEQKFEEHVVGILINETLSFDPLAND